MPLTHVFRKISDAWSDKQRRHISEINEYSTDVHHISGTDNVVADSLSRVAAVFEGVSSQQLASAQKLCDDTCRYSAGFTQNSSLSFAEVPFDEAALLFCATCRRVRIVQWCLSRFAGAYLTQHISLHTLVFGLRVTLCMRGFCGTAWPGMWASGSDNVWHISELKCVVTFVLPFNLSLSRTRDLVTYTWMWSVPYQFLTVSRIF